MPKMELTLDDFRNIPADSKPNLRGLCEESADNYFSKGLTPEEKEKLDKRRYREKQVFLYTVRDILG